MRGAITAAVALDLAFGEPPAPFHPTVGMGRMITAGRVRRTSTSLRRSFIEGAATVVAGAVITGIAASVVDRALAGSQNLPRRLVQGGLLKPALSARDLLRAARLVESALERGRLKQARELLSWHLVSRDTSQLPASGVAAAAIESLAENFNDAVVAPLFWYRAGGLAAAYVFRFVNTADAMIGYRTQDLEWFGKTAARLDDLLAFVPARLSALLIAMSASAIGEAGGSALARAVLDSSNTSSPNAGWPMAAMAGALSVRLEKVDHYVLNTTAHAPNAADIRRARRIILVATGLAALLAEVS